MSGRLASVILSGFSGSFLISLALLLRVFLSDWLASKRRSGTA